MTIKKLLLHNFKSFQDQTEIIFPEVSEEKNIFLIGGMNGAGKTSIMEAISIALYGAKKSFIYKNINRNEFSRKNYKVNFELELETEEKDILNIKRSFFCNDIENPNPGNIVENLQVVKNGQIVSIKNHDLWQQYILSEFPKAITQFFFFDGEKIQEFASDDHFEIGLKSSLESALGIRFLSQLANDITKVKQETRKNFSDVTDVDIKYKENNLNILKEKKAKLEKNKQFDNKELLDMEKDFESINKEFKLRFSVDPNQEQERKAKDQRKVKESAKLAQIENEIKNMAENYLSFALASPLFDEIKKQIDLESRNSNILTNSEFFKQFSDAAIDSLHKSPMLITQQLSLENQQEFKNRLKEQVLATTKKNINDKEYFLDLTEREMGQILQKIKEVEKSDIHRMSSLIEEKLELKNSLKILLEENIFETISQDQVHSMSQMQEELNNLSAQIAIKNEDLNNLVDEILNLDQQINDEEKQLSNLYNQLEISNEKKEFLKECENLSNMIDEFVVTLRKNKIKTLRTKVLEMYKLLSNKKDLTSDIEINDESYEVKIKDINNIEITKSNLSAGEKEVFAISLLWGLAQTSKINLPIIIDTPLSRLDSTHRKNIVQNYFPNAGNQVIILSTDTEVDEKHYFDLEKYLSGSGQLVFDKNQKKTIYKDKYFSEIT